MKTLKTFFAWYTARIAPFSTAIRPMLRRALLITSLGLDAVALIFIIHGVFPLGKGVMSIAATVTCLLFAIALSLFLLYMATLRFDLDDKSLVHWSNIIPGVLFIGNWIIGVGIMTICGRDTAEWKGYIDTSVITMLALGLSLLLAALHAKLRAHAKAEHCGAQTK